MAVGTDRIGKVCQSEDSSTLADSACIQMPFLNSHAHYRMTLRGLDNLASGIGRKAVLAEEFLQCHRL